MALGILVLGTATAVADPAPDDPKIDLKLPSWSVLAQLTSEGTASTGGSDGAGELVIGGELRSTMPMCTLFEAGAFGRLREDRDGPQLGGDQTLSACFGMDQVIAMEVDHHLELSTRPSLADRRDLWRRPFTRETVNFQTTWFDLATQRFRVTAVHTELGVAVVTQTADDRARWLTDVDARAQIAELTGFGDDPWQLSVIDFHDITTDDGTHSAETFQLMFLRAANLRLGGGALLDGAIGVHVANLMLDQPEMPVMLVMTTRPAAELALHGHIGHRFEAGAGVARSEYPTFDVELAREDRATAWLTLHHGHTDVTARGFTARTQVTPANDVPERGITGGGEAQLDRDARDVHIAVTAEAARSYYAQVDSTVAAAPRPELAMRVTLALSLRRAGRR